MTLYLYQAMIKVLDENNNKPMTIEQIAEAINKKGLYRKKNGYPIDTYGVGLRAVSDVSEGPTYFEVLVRLRK